MEDNYVLKMDNIVKEYGGNAVLKGVSFGVKKGEIHALLGENGAGKSTLMNILFGMPVIHSTGGFQGRVEIDGNEVQITTPRHAMELGIGMVHQEFMLIPGFTVTENIKIAREKTTPGIMSRVFGKSLEKLNMPEMAKDAKISLDKVGLDIDEYARVAGMPVGYMQFIEISRELDKTGIQLLVFDEPTAVLTESEAEKLMEAMRKIAASGIAIIFITHRLDEVIEVADNITVLRDGELVATREKKDTNVIELAELMVGRSVGRIVTDSEDNQRVKPDKVAISFRDYSVDMPGEKVRHLDLDVYEGEILGIGGLAGQGKVGIPNGLMSMYDASGDVEVFGDKFDLHKLGAALDKGIACVSEDRKGVGLLLDMPIEDNIIFGAMRTNGKFLKKMGITQRDSAAIRSHANQMIQELDIRCTGPKQPVGRLSGGNQQKVCLARAITMNPKILMVSEPTRGIDIGAKELVLKKLVEINRTEGITVIVVSSELAELRSLCDRIAIVSSGKVVDILAPDANDADFGLAMSGLKKGDA